MEKNRKLLYFLLIALLVGGAVWVVLTVPPAPDKTDFDKNGTVISYDGNEISEEKDGRKIWDLTAEHIDVDVESHKTTMQNLTGHFYAPDGRVTEIKADKGDYDEKSRDVIITGNVDIKNSDGAALSSKELRWQAKEEMLIALGDVRATKDDMRAEGDRMESSDGFNKIKIIGKAHIIKGGETK